MHTFTDVIAAVASLAERSGALSFMVGFDGDETDASDSPHWFCQAAYKQAIVRADHHTSPTGAALVVAEAILSTSTCKCGQRVALNDDDIGCRWFIDHDKFQPSCDAPTIHMSGDRGDLVAIQEQARAAGVFPAEPRSP
jgi:hypothetical protein